MLPANTIPAGFTMGQHKCISKISTDVEIEQVGFMGICFMYPIVEYIFVQ